MEIFVSGTHRCEKYLLINHRDLTELIFYSVVIGRTLLQNLDVFCDMPRVGKLFRNERLN